MKPKTTIEFFEDMQAYIREKECSDANNLTYGMIFREFKNKNPEIEIIDYRPCCELFGFPCIKNAIVI